MSEEYNIDLFINEYIIYSPNNIICLSELVDKYEDWYENNISKSHMPEKMEIRNLLKKSKLEKYIITENNKIKLKNIRLKDDLIDDKLLENEYFVSKDFEIWKLEIENYKLENEIKIINLKKLINNNKILELENENKSKIKIINLETELLKLKNENKILKLENETKKDLIGSIYKIEYKENPEIRYIGSTTKTIKNRYSSHKTKYFKWLENDDYGKCEIYEYFKIYGIENFEITLLKEFKILNKCNLLAYEQLYMNKLVNINKNNAFSI